MPECQNCESFVTKEYVRVALPEGREHPETCPHCPNHVSEWKQRIKNTRRASP